MSFQSPEVRTGCVAKSQEMRENAWFWQHSEKNEKKRAKTMLKNEGTAARPEKRKKRMKTRGFRQVLEERARENDEKASPEARTRGLKNA